MKSRDARAIWDHSSRMRLFVKRKSDKSAGIPVDAPLAPSATFQFAQYDFRPRIAINKAISGPGDSAFGTGTFVVDEHEKSC